MKHRFSSSTGPGLLSVLSGLIVPRKSTASSDDCLDRLPTTLDSPPREIELPSPESPTKDETEDMVFVSLKHNHMRSIDTSSDAVVVAVSDDEKTTIEPFCSVCETSKERPLPFHFCVRNPVVDGPYRTKFGPIERPNKNRISHAT
ncbi:hypothetical protein QJS10_CPB19g00477 [Acorus calamus]|uniref:Uncharacterized protein n=1 Tax=Acorus calamus TaxID=4465 RepID=A0AAV9CIN9_ACOCL|nr:hypothetical protein QJS10_CPB19g00477 [Acorus calamus]